MLGCDIIDDYTFEFLNVSQVGRFHLLPKIHKPDILCRSICSSNKHPTENISRFVEYNIQKYVADLPSTVRDTQHFVKRITILGRAQTSPL